MRILHTSDWHLGKRLEGFSRLEEQEAVLAEICEIAEREDVHAIVISGDLFDTFNPPAEAVELFYRSLKRLACNGRRAVIAIAGNHDMPERIDAPDPLARECGIIFAGSPNALLKPFSLEPGMALTRSEEGFIELHLQGAGCPLRLLLTPYANELRLKSCLGVADTGDELRKVLGLHWHHLAEKYCDTGGVNLLVAHLLFAPDAGSLPEEPEEQRRINYVGGAPAIFTDGLPDGIGYVALGHLHRHQVVATKPCPVVYSGSPLAYSFSEADQDKFVVMVEAGAGEPVTTRKILLEKGRRLVRMRFGDIGEAVEWLTANQEVFVELTIVSDQYLAAVDRKRLLDAHPAIVTIIPESRAKAGESNESGRVIDLTKGIEELFIDFFNHKKGQDPGGQIMEIFREVIAEEGQS
ncbi:MAG: exonuclease subunit SbcD [Bacteroidota bacterium]